MQLLPPALSDVIEAFGSLPGVGPRTAERYAYYLLRHGNETPQKLARALKELNDGIGYCRKTFALVPAGQELSDLYTDPRRDKTVVAVVAEPFGPEQLHIEELIKRVDEDKVKEIILATNASVEGESTALYIQQQIGKRKVKVTRLARGLSVGVDLEYADQITLGRALADRQAL